MIDLTPFRDSRLYFAYGSNMSPSRIEERKLKMRFVGVGYLNHYKLMFNKISQKDPTKGFANIVPFWGKRVYGVVYDMANEPFGTTRFMDGTTDAQKTNALSTIADNLFKLDKYEGYPNHYQRTCVTIKMDNANRIAFTYIAVPEKTSPGNLFIDEKYISKINEGLEQEFFEDFSKEANEYKRESIELMNIWKTS